MPLGRIAAGFLRLASSAPQAQLVIGVGLSVDAGSEEMVTQPD
jgi:hypothetical protein